MASKVKKKAEQVQQIPTITITNNTDVKDVNLITFDRGIRVAETAIPAKGNLSIEIAPGRTFGVYVPPQESENK